MLRAWCFGLIGTGLLGGLLPLSPQTAQAPARAAPDCPEAELSCGRQRPVLSDGVRPFTNDDMFLAITFPAWSQVCMTRSGNAPRGFFAIYGVPPGCPERPERPPRFITLHGQYNAVGHADLAAALGETCRPLSAATARRLGGAALALPGYASRVCETRSANGAIALSVNALAGPWREWDMPVRRIRAAIYEASLGTTDAHFDEDLARFRRVLASVRIDGRG